MEGRGIQRQNRKEPNGCGWGGRLCEEEGVENVPDFCIKEAGVGCTQRGRQRSGVKGQGEGKTRWYNFLRN